MLFGVSRSGDLGKRFVVKGKLRRDGRGCGAVWNGEKCCARCGESGNNEIEMIICIYCTGF